MRKPHGPMGGEELLLAGLARALEVHPSDLYRWRRELEEHGERAFSGAGKKRAEETKGAGLERNCLRVNLLRECDMAPKRKNAQKMTVGQSHLRHGIAYSLPKSFADRRH